MGSNLHTIFYIRGVTSPKNALTALRHSFTERQLKDIADLNGLDISTADIRHVRQWADQGCMKGFKKVVALLEIAGYVTIIKSERG